MDDFLVFACAMIMILFILFVYDSINYINVNLLERIHGIEDKHREFRHETNQRISALEERLSSDAPISSCEPYPNCPIQCERLSSDKL